MSLVIFIALVVAAAFIGSRFEPGAWYAQLTRPEWTPPNWLFAPVWSALYVMIAVAGWLVWRSTRTFVPALGFWGLQLALNTLWSWLFFGLHRPGLALLDVALLIGAILAFIASARYHSPLASWLFAPYLLWTCFAAALNLAIVRLN